LKEWCPQVGSKRRGRNRFRDWVGKKPKARGKSRWGGGILTTTKKGKGIGGGGGKEWGHDLNRG